MLLARGAFLLALVGLIGVVVTAAYLPSPNVDNPILVRAASPNVAVYGQTSFNGTCDDVLCSWLGIRYAAAPVGNFRFAPPKRAPATGTMVSATKLGARCPQAGAVEAQNEDCLFLNIQRPSSAPLSTKLPVLVFFHGGGFEQGSGNDNDPKAFINLGHQNQQDVVVVRINYRLGLFGFLASSELSKLRDQNAANVGFNLGFRDMKMATTWVKDHIDSFGGDSNRITIWGQSAGSFGASAMLLAYANSAPPFKAAIMESGSAGGVPVDVVAKKDDQYNRVLAATKCNTASDHLQCLRSVQWQDLRTTSLAESSRAMQPATYTRGFYAWTAVLDGGPSRRGFFTQPPSAVINADSFARVPVLHGDCEDEGTYFAPHTFNDVTPLSKWLATLYFADPTSNATVSLVNKVLQAYPDVPAQGSPYVPVGATPDDRFFGATNQYKRAASVYGDIRYQSNRRFFLDALARNNVPAYSYLYAQHTDGNAASLGVPHGADLSALLQSQPNPMSVTYARQYLAFATSNDPNAASGLPTWPRYQSSSRQLLEYRNGAIKVITDDFRRSAIGVLNSPDVLRVTGR